MKAFGDVNYAVELDRAPTPVGQKCLGCDEPIVEGDSGILSPYYDGKESKEVPQHEECVMRALFGSVGHQQAQEKNIRCSEGLCDDPPEMTKRQSAKAAADYAKRHKRQMPPLD